MSSLSVAENKTYWKNRRAGKPGLDRPEVKRYNKGEKIEYTNREGEVVEYPNKLGSHLVRVPGKGLQYLNRTQSRTRAVDRSFTKPGSTSHVKDPKKDPRSDEFISPKPLHPPKLTNHVRHRERQIVREQAAFERRKKQELSKESK